MSRVAYKPKTICLIATASWVTQPIPSGVRYVRFISVDGQVGVRINNTGNNYMEFSPGFASFEIPIREDSVVELIGGAGNEKLCIYIR